MAGEEVAGASGGLPRWGKDRSQPDLKLSGDKSLLGCDLQAWWRDVLGGSAPEMHIQGSDIVGDDQQCKAMQ